MFEIFQLITNYIFVWGYIGIILLMLIESSFIPFPSEIVMIPAGYLAFQGKMDPYLVVLCGITGSILGALLNYYLSLYLGRSLVAKYGKFVGFTENKLDKVDDFFKRHGAFSTFIGRLIPVIRQLISIPAGITRMNIKQFIIYTGLGAGIWMVVLTAIGYLVGHNEELIRQYLDQVTIALLILVPAMVLAYRLFNKKKGQSEL